MIATGENEVAWPHAQGTSIGSRYDRDEPSLASPQKKGRLRKMPLVEFDRVESAETYWIDDPMLKHPAIEQIG